MVAWIQSYHPRLQWKFKLWSGKFSWGVKVKHCCQQSFENKKFVDNTQQCFAFTPQANFPVHNLNFHWRWRWWDWIRSIFLNLFYFIDFFCISQALYLFLNIDFNKKHDMYIISAMRVMTLLSTIPLIQNWTRWGQSWFKSSKNSLQ